LVNFVSIAYYDALFVTFTGR